jgi:hypothetical protein
MAAVVIGRTRLRPRGPATPNMSAPRRDANKRRAKLPAHAAVSSALLHDFCAFFSGVVVAIGRACASRVWGGCRVNNQRARNAWSRDTLTSASQHRASAPTSIHAADGLVLSPRRARQSRRRRLLRADGAGRACDDESLSLPALPQVSKLQRRPAAVPWTTPGEALRPCQGQGERERDSVCVCVCVLTARGVARWRVCRSLCLSTRAHGRGVLFTDYIGRGRRDQITPPTGRGSRRIRCAR